MTTAMSKAKAKIITDVKITSATTFSMVCQGERRGRLSPMLTTIRPKPTMTAHVKIMRTIRLNANLGTCPDPARSAQNIAARTNTDSKIPRPQMPIGRSGAKGESGCGG